MTRRTLFIILLLATDALAELPPVVRRAVEAFGGKAALARAQSISVVMLGSQDQSLIAQGYFADKRTPNRQQDTLIIDMPNRRAAKRTEGVWSDGSPNSWLWTVLGDSGSALKLKTGRVMRMNEERSAAMFEQWRWEVPQLALADMLARAEKLKCDDNRCAFETASGVPFTIAFDPQTGFIAGYEYEWFTMTGRQPVRYTFKSYDQSPVGFYPTGYRMTIGDRVYKDLEVVDVRNAVDLDELPWMKAPPPDAKPVSTVSQQPPASIDEVADGLWFMKNVGGWNVMLARVNDCIAVIDAPASFGHAGGAIPSRESPPDLSALIMEKVEATLGRKVCYVVPTHHHNDHFGGIRGFGRAGVTIVTSPGNESLARITAGNDATIQIVREKTTLGSGDSRMDVWVIRNDPHAEEMIFVHFPKPRVIFEGDLSDYVLSARNLLRFIDRNALAVDRVYSSHSSRSHSLNDLVWEDPGN